MYTDDSGMVVIRGRLPQEIAALLEKALQAAMEALEEEGRKEGKEGVLPDEDSVCCVSAETSGAGGQADADDSAENCAPSVIPAQAGVPGAHVGTDGLDVSAETSEDLGLCDVDVSAEALERSVAREGGGLPPRSRTAQFPATQWARATGGNDSAEFRCRESLAQRRVDALGLLAEAALGNGLGQTEREERYQVVIHVDSAVLADRSHDGLCELDTGHHIEHWARGGETNPDHLLVVCKFHHWAIHEGGIRVEGRTHPGLVFHRPDGTVLSPCSVRVPINGEAGETLKEVNRRCGRRITANTVDSFWGGEPIDLHMAVDALLTYDDDPIDVE